MNTVKIETFLSFIGITAFGCKDEITALDVLQCEIMKEAQKINFISDHDLLPPDKMRLFLTVQAERHCRFYGWTHPSTSAALQMSKDIAAGKVNIGKIGEAYKMADKAYTDADIITKRKWEEAKFFDDAEHKEAYERTVKMRKSAENVVALCHYRPSYSGPNPAAVVDRLIELIMAEVKADQEVEK